MYPYNVDIALNTLMLDELVEVREELVREVDELAHPDELVMF